MKSSKVNTQIIYDKNFEKIRSQQEFVIDASRKSSYDYHIKDLIELINNSQNYFTTSSCSGRFLAFSQNEEFVKKNCEWIKVTHDPLKETEIEELISLIENSKIKHDIISLKFEPFILHICCRSLEHAKLMLEQCVESGLRNSGISVGRKKIILAVRSTQNLECPITKSGKLIVDHEYIRIICKMANEKFNENFERIERFMKNIQKTCLCLIKDDNFVENKKELLDNREKKKFERFVDKNLSKKESNNDLMEDDSFCDLFNNN